MKEHEEARIQAWKEEIDTELVFAALFSAILTAFDVEAYKMLQPQGSNNPSVFILTNNSQLDMSTLKAIPLPDTGPPTPYAVAINALWFAALICSLAAASVSILVRQWLNQYTSGLASVSPEIAQVRQFRKDSLRKWKVGGIMTLLPILLQGSLVLFLIGLVLFLKQLNITITIIASVLIAILLAFVLVTTILPTFMDDCSYQSPQAWGFFVVFQALKKPLRSVCRTVSARAKQWAASGVEGYSHRLRTRLAKRLVQKLAPFANKPNTYSWIARERILVEATGPALDEHLLVAADATFLEDAFLRDVIRPCLADMPAAAAVQCYYAIVAHRADRIERGLPYYDAHRGRPESVAALADLTLDALLKTRVAAAGPFASMAREHAVRVMRILEPLLVRALPLAYPHFCRVFFQLLNDPDPNVAHLAFSILYQQLWRNLALAEQHASEDCHDLAALVAFIARARTDENLKHFLDACDLVICLGTLPSLPPAGCAALRAPVARTLTHLEAFFATPLWRDEPRLLYPIARIAPRLAALARRDPRALPDALREVLREVVVHARTLNQSGNWEDKLIVLEAALRELSALREDIPVDLSPFANGGVPTRPMADG
ncbi:hypothetical protein BD413DRAFT_610551 [Trametes elegans]|nr:hypothetical protein BD413DRAFT_610551 [Trametes elegans]